MSLLRQGKAQVLTIYLGESDQWQGTPLYVAIVQYLREQGCAGATVTRAVAGYGAGSRLHESGGWQWSSDALVIIQVVDQPDRLRRLLPHLQEMLSGGVDDPARERTPQVYPCPAAWAADKIAGTASDGNLHHHGESRDACAGSGRSSACCSVPS